ncbi:tyrosine-type recombinase/integrase [Pseudomonadota bacterium]
MKSAEIKVFPKQSKSKEGQNLTNILIKSLPVKARRAGKAVELSDPANRGFRVRCTKRGKITFVYRFTHPETKKLRRVFLGSYPTISLVEARTKYQTLANSRYQGLDPKQIEVARIEKERGELATTERDTTVKDLIGDYLKAKTKLRSIKETQRLLYKHLVPKYENVPAREITRANIRAILQPLTGASSHNACLAAIRGMYGWALEEEYPVDNPLVTSPTTRIKQKKVEPRSRTLNESELADLITKRIPKLPIQYAQLIEFIFRTAVRVGEATDLPWREIFLDIGEWRIPATRTKNGKPHVVYLAPQVIEILKQQPKGKWVWPNDSTHHKHARKDMVQKLVSNLRQGMERFTIHDARRAFSSWVGMKGYPPEVNDRCLNHVQQSIRTVYNTYRYDEQAKQCWIDWNNYLDGLTDTS